MTEPTVLHDDRQWLVLNKPAGWHCVETKNTDGRPVVETWLREQFDACRELPEAGLAIALISEPRAASWSPNGDRSGNACAAPCPAIPPRVRRKPTSRWLHQVCLRWVDLSCSFLVTKPESAPAKRTSRTTGGVPLGIDSTCGNDAQGAEQFDAIEVGLVGPGRRHQIRRACLISGTHWWTTKHTEAAWAEGTGWAALHAHRITLDGTTVAAPPPEAWHLESLQPDDPS